MRKFDPRPVRVGFVVDEVASGQIFLTELLYSSVTTIPPLLLAQSFIHSFIHLFMADALYSQQLTPSVYKTLYCDRIVVRRDDVQKNHSENIKFHSIIKFLLI